jgi:thiosulfate reductase cytochrome b subunit
MFTTVRRCFYYLSLPVFFVISFQGLAQICLLFTQTPLGLCNLLVACLTCVVLRSTRNYEAQIMWWIERTVCVFAVVCCWVMPLCILAFGPGFCEIRRWRREEARQEEEVRQWVRDIVHEVMHGPQSNLCSQMAELIETEISYLESLREFEQCILTPIREAPDKAGLRPDDVNKLVAHFPEIIGLVQSFVDQLRACHHDQDVAEAFLRFSGHFKMYGALAVNLFGHSPWIRLQGSDNREFRAFVRSALRDAAHHSLDDYSIMAVQRITRYPLLFKDIDARCFQASEQLARHVNGAVRDIEKTMVVPVFAIDFEKEELLAQNRQLRCVRNYLGCALSATMVGGLAAWLLLK